MNAVDIVQATVGRGIVLTVTNSSGESYYEMHESLSFLPSNLIY